jgi:enoyl-CoA hydratase/carnithine racemase
VPHPAIRLERSGDVATLVIDRAEKRNSLTTEMWDAIPEACAEADADRSVKLLVVRGAAEAFCSGADVSEYRARLGEPGWEERSQTSVSAAFAALRGMAKPTVAAIRGPCIGGGVGIALACDLRLADPSARLAVPPARLGIVYPFVETKNLVDLVGPSRAKRLLFTAETVDALEALAMGLLDEVVAADAFEDRLVELTARICSVSQQTVRAAKRVIALVLAGQTEESPETRALAAAALAGEDHAEGVRAFADKREPVFDFR